MKKKSGTESHVVELHAAAKDGASLEDGEADSTAIPAPSTAELELLEQAGTELDKAGPAAILEWTFGHYGDDASVACSFGGVSGMVLMHMAQEIQPTAETFYIDTDYLFPETYETVEAARKRWPDAPIRAYSPTISPDEQAREYGEHLWERDPDLCCDIRKVEPNRRALANKRAWISGLRRDQSEERASTPAVQWDEKFGLVKANPLINWDEKLLWAYIFEHEIPYNPLHDRNFPSIGCTNCTRAVLPGEDPRAGRWSGFEKSECGLHVPS